MATAVASRTVRKSSKPATTKRTAKPKQRFDADSGDFYKIPSQKQFTMLGIAAFNGMVFENPMATFASREVAKKEIDRAFETGYLEKQKG